MKKTVPRAKRPSADAPTGETRGRDPLQRPGLSHNASVDRWALVVGISRYADRRLRLRYAANDAAKLHTTLLEPTAGAFAEDHVLPLIDGEATLAALNKALRTFLKRPGPDDLVVLFFACHGSRDPERPDNLYLLPHDTDPDDVSGTALPMREVEQALRETLHSRRVVVLVDACHSGGLGDAFANLRAAGDDAADLNAYLGALSSSRGGVSLMTSAMANESSVEGKRWGDGHGVFTHFVLEGLRGKADRPPYDGVVTVGELFDYVHQRVKDETAGRQHPHISAAADRDLVLAVTGSLSASQHAELAERLSTVADLLGDPACWRGAAKQYAEAMRLRGEAARPAWGVQQAVALYRSGNAGAAEQALRQLPRDLPGVRHALGLVELACGRADDARATLLKPEPASPSAGRLFVPGVLRRRRSALLVGLNVLDPVAFNNWDGRLVTPVAEVRALGELLQERFGFDAEDTAYLLDSHATMDAIRAALQDLVQQSASCEAVVFAFSGHGSQMRDKGPSKDRPDATLVAFDGQLASAEIDALLSQSVAGRTTLIVSAAHSGRFAERALAGGYEAITSCAEDQVDFEQVDRRFSVFMDAMLPHLTPDATSEALIDATRRAVKASGHRQDPQFAIDPGSRLLVGDRTGNGPVGEGAVLAHVLLGVTAAESSQVLDEISRLAVRGELPAETLPILALEWRRRDEFARVAALPIPLEGGSNALACAAMAAAARRPHVHALAATLRHLAASPVVSALPELKAEVEALALLAPGRDGVCARARAVLVGLSSLHDDGAGVKDSAASVAAVRDALIASGVPARSIRVLVDAEATGVALRAALLWAGRRADRQAVLVYWCGPGSMEALRCFDEASLGADDVARLAGAQAALLADGIQAGAAPSPLLGKQKKTPRLIVAAPLPAEERTGEHLRGESEAASGGCAPMAEALVQLLRKHPDPGSARASMLATRHGRPTVLSMVGDDRLLADPIVDRVDVLAARVGEAELSSAAALLSRLLEQRNGQDSEAQLQLGILLAELGELDGAVEAFERAIQQFGDERTGEALARLHLGRVLLHSGRDRARAVSECRLATERDPELTAAWFWLGRAISELIERETSTQASEALRTYLARGAPLGRRAEAAALLGALAGKGGATGTGSG